MRIDRALVCLRLARTRSRARAMIEAGHMRRNGARIARCSLEIEPGDVLTLCHAGRVRVLEILTLPPQRPSPEIAQRCYRELDRAPQTDIAASHQPLIKGVSSP